MAGSMAVMRNAHGEHRRRAALHARAAVAARRGISMSTHGIIANGLYYGGRRADSLRPPAARPRYACISARNVAIKALAAIMPISSYRVPIVTCLRGRAAGRIAVLRVHFARQPRALMLAMYAGSSLMRIIGDHRPLIAAPLPEPGRPCGRAARSG